MKSIGTRLATLAVGLVALVGIGAGAQAAQFVYAAPCLTGCSAIGVADGTFVGALIGVDDSAIAPNTVIDQGDVTSFTALVNSSLSFSLADLVNLAILLDGNSAPAFWLFTAANASGQFLALNDGNGQNAFVAVADGTAVGGPGVMVGTVPEPTTLVLAALGLAVAGVARARRR